MGALLQIGEMAHASGLSADAIRFYERKRLLRRATRSGGGFRLFSESDLSDLKFIRSAQELGFSLQEIRDLVTLKNTEHPDCARVERMLEHKIASVQAKIAALRKLERELTRTMLRCQANLHKAARGESENCPALSEISASNGKNKR